MPDPSISTHSVLGTEVPQVPVSKLPKVRKTMQTQLEALRDGQITFDQFGKSTFDQWESIARWLMGHWPCPPGVGLEDVIQELMIAAWHFVPKWDPKYGVKIQRYVTYNAIDKAKKWMNKQRGAGAEGDKGKSRYPLSFAALGGDDVALFRVSTSGSPEEHCCAYERGMNLSRALAKKKNRISENDRAWILMFGECGWDPDVAAMEAFGDLHARQFFRLESVETARVAAHHAMDVAAWVACKELDS